MPFKGRAPRRKFAELLVKSEISPETSRSGTGPVMPGCPSV
jgi:hypothetical protein